MRKTIVLMSEVVQPLLEYGPQYGVDANTKDEDGKTVLVYSAEEGHTEIVKLLLEVGADVNAKDDSGRTALMNTAFGGHTDTVRLLIMAEADMRARDEDGNTAFLLCLSGDGTVRTP